MPRSHKHNKKESTSNLSWYYMEPSLKIQSHGLPHSVARGARNNTSSTVLSCAPRYNLEQRQKHEHSRPRHLRVLTPAFAYDWPGFRDYKSFSARRHAGPRTSELDCLRRACLRATALGSTPAALKNNAKQAESHLANHLNKTAPPTNVYGNDRYPRPHHVISKCMYHARAIRPSPCVPGRCKNMRRACLPYAYYLKRTGKCQDACNNNTKTKRQ